MITSSISRRGALKSLASGFGYLAFAGLAQSQATATERSVGGLTLKAPHFAPRAKRVIFLCMNGGPSHVDTWDPKPQLTKMDGKTISDDGVAMRSPFKFSRYGQSGLEVSDLFAKTAAAHIDDMCVIRGMYADVPNHEPSLLLMNCGDGRQRQWRYKLSEVSNA